jgi:hypothetical protein
MSRTTLAAVAAGVALAVVGVGVWLTAGGGAAPAKAAWKVTSTGFALHAQGCGDATLPSFYLKGNGNFLFWAPEAVGGRSAAHSVSLRERATGKGVDRARDHARTSHATVRGGAYALDVRADGCWRLDVQGDVHTRAGGPEMGRA